MPRTRTYGLDIDTIRYAQRVKSGSGTTILPEPLKQINKFVVGVKKLGLWNSMVCWPMRSIHNAGTGSTVYSLGGLRVSNGTMINSPVWGYNGIFFNGNDSEHYITIPDNTISSGTSDFSMGGVAAVVRKESGDQRSIIISHDNGNSSTAPGTVNAEDFTINRVAVSETWDGAVFYISPRIRNFNFIIHTLQSQILYGLYNSLFMGSDSTLRAGYNRLGQLITIGAGRTGGTSTYGKTFGTISFSFTFNRDILNQHQFFYSLYRASLGVGLSLP